MSGSAVDGKNKNVRLAAILPFKVSEAAAGKPLRISGVAMVAGLSRNLNVYTPEELVAFAEKLKGAPVYIEHISASDAVGKVNETAFDPALRAITYVAEIYDEAVAEKIRNGLIQHVSVGADYQVIDLVDAKVPRGLYNAELSLVAVPGMPETTIQVLEHLAKTLKPKVAALGAKSPVLKVGLKELLEPLGPGSFDCVFCGAPGEYLVSTCVPCGDRAAGITQAAMEFVAGFDPAKGEGDFSSLVVFERVGGRFGFKLSNGYEGVKLEEKDLEKLAEKVASKLKVKEALMLKCPKCEQEFDAAEWEANGWKCPNADCGVEVVPPEPVVLSLRGQQSTAERLRVVEQTEAELQAQVERSQQFGIGIKEGGNVTKPEEYSSVSDEQFADPVNYRYPIDDAEHVQAALVYFNVPENRSDYAAEEQAKILAKIVEAGVAAGIEVTYQAEDAAYEALPEELKAKCQGYTAEQSTEERLAVAEQKVKDQDKLLEKFRKVAPGVELLVDPPVLMPVAEAVADIKAVLPAAMVQRSWSLGPQRMCQELHRVINKLERRAGGR